MIPLDPLEITLKVTRAFQELGIDYFIGGSLASSVYGVVRSTNDADLIADVRLEHLQPLIERLSAEFYIDPNMILTAILSSSSFNLLHIETVFKVDIFILNQQPFDLNRMQRRTLHYLGGFSTEQIFVSSAEDMILAKLQWYRAGGELSDRQWSDIVGMLKIQANQLDFAYMQDWAIALGIADLLQGAIKEAGS